MLLYIHEGSDIIKTIGIIAEYNPFHNGHLYHLNKTKKMFPNHLIILILSGNYTQRGEKSIIDKFNKTEIALKYGIDLIIELPYNFATQSADEFAKGSIELLNNLKCEHVVFGSEENNIQVLEANAKKIINNELEIKSHIKLGKSYAAAIGENILTSTPNDILGICYIKEIIKNNYNIKYHSIKRTSDYHDIKSNEEIISASNIREKIKNKEDIKKYLPCETAKFINNSDIEDFYLLKYNILNNINNLDDFLGVNTGLAGRIKKYINSSDTTIELISNIKTKSYTYSTISRALCHILCNFKKEDNDKSIQYIRILGFNNTGKKYLKLIKKNINIPIITKFSDYDFKYQIIEKRLNYIYYFNKENKENELTKKIIIN